MYEGILTLVTLVFWHCTSQRERLFSGYFKDLLINQLIFTFIE